MTILKIRHAPAMCYFVLVRKWERKCNETEDWPCHLLAHRLCRLCWKKVDVIECMCAYDVYGRFSLKFAICGLSLFIHFDSLKRVSGTRRKKNKATK